MEPPGFAKTTATKTLEAMNPEKQISLTIDVTADGSGLFLIHP